MKKLSVPSNIVGKLDREDRPTKEESLRHGPCEVYGCPKDGHIHTGNWNCRYHWNRHGEILSRITFNLNKYESDVNWYEQVLRSTTVDYDLKEVHKRAPYGLEPKEDEKYIDYKKRLAVHVESILRS